MSSSNQRPENRGFRSVLRCAITHYRQVPSLSAPEPRHGTVAVSDGPWNNETAGNEELDTKWATSSSA